MTKEFRRNPMTNPMRNIIVATLAVLLALLSFASLSFGAEDDINKRKEDAKWRIDLIRKGLLAQELGLDEATLAKLVGINDRYDSERKKLIEERRDNIAALDKAIKKENVNESEIGGIVNKLVGVEDKIYELRKKETGELDKILTTEQMGRYILFNDRFNKEIMRLIRKVGDRKIHEPLEQKK